MSDHECDVLREQEIRALYLGPNRQLNNPDVEWLLDALAAAERERDRSRAGLADLARRAKERTDELLRERDALTEALREIGEMGHDPRTDSAYWSGGTCAEVARAALAAARAETVFYAELETDQQVERLLAERERLRALARAARSIAAAPDYDEEAIRDALWALVDAALAAASEAPATGRGGCIHTPARCNGGGYDGCACGPYEAPATGDET